MKWRMARGLGAVLGLLQLTSCIISGDVCDAHQVEVEDSDHLFCACEPNAVIDSDGVGCTPCGENEQAKGEACVCKEGFVKPAGGTCETSEIGARCQVASDCPSGFPYCVNNAAGGYCSSQGCSTLTDCPNGWSCEEANGTHYCRKPPSGLGASCGSNDDCQGLEAAYCDTLATHSCILQGCNGGGVVCPNEWACCDYSALLGSAFSTCAAPDQLSDGACPSAGTLVAP